ncbi:MAG: septum formation initiator family protein [Verrucomicrobiota bacterium]|nr:septum formation initiator family protein [Verrucomicrobiota bacterium]
MRELNEESVWHSLNRLVVALIVLAMLTVAVCAFLPELKRQREQAVRLDELRTEIDKQKELLARRTREVDLLKNDPGYVEVIARDRLDLMKPGETIFRLDPPPVDKTKFKLNQ